MCSFEKKIGVVLEVSADLPSQDELDRWCGEPVKSLLLPTSIFLTNRRGYPVLSRQHQAFIKAMAQLDVQVIIKGHTRHDNLNNYQKYINHLWQVGS